MKTSSGYKRRARVEPLVERTQHKGNSECAVGLGSTDEECESAAAPRFLVLANPTCRWSTWEARLEGEEPPAGQPRTLQERAWSSPIGYTP